MPKLTETEQDALRRLGNHIHDVLINDLQLSDQTAERITEHVIRLIQIKAEGKE